MGWEFQPEDFDRRREREAEEFLRNNLQPITGTCKTCQADLTDDPHEGWCPEK